MTAENFCYWAQGFFEISNAKFLDEVRTQILKDHLALVLKKETPNYVWNQDVVGGLGKSMPDNYGGIKLLCETKVENVVDKRTCC